MIIILGILAALAALVGLGALIALPAIAIAYFGKTDYIPAGVTAHEVDNTVWAMFGIGNSLTTDFTTIGMGGAGGTSFNIDQFTTPDIPENPVQRAIKEQELRLGREE